MSTTAKEVARALEKIAPISSGVPGDELGFVYGDPDAAVNGVSCIWCCDTFSIRECVRRKCNMIICHEALWLPPQKTPWYQGPEEGEIFSNRERRKLLDKHKIVVYRSHSNWDALREIGIADSAVAALGIKGMRELARQKFFSVHRLGKSISAGELLKKVEKGLEYASCRLFGDPKKRIRRFALLIGGFGENQWHIAQAARDMGAEAVIIGEMSEFIVIACMEMGMPVIESLHSASEMPGIRNQAAALAKALPGLKVEFIPSGAAR